ncbi:thioredoxin domain-containing 2-like [Paramuricea clavata]|uniref:Thioredoxin domain-containing 2-like n=1 Tax=Paramuricea clavata TaxID=317549 RepID=A0A7D9EEM0_PARCT|nr:thioredoxin domain-containing 2-like [Paramuricea clavata]
MCNSSIPDYDRRHILVVFHFIFLYLGVLGNIAVIIYNIFLNRDKTPRLINLTTHLALADLLVCLAFYPTKIVLFFHSEVKVDLLFCKIKRTTIFVSLFLSIMMLLSITIDKYLYITKPLKYPLIVTTRRTRILLRCIWLAALVQIPPIFIYMESKKTSKPGKCHYPLPVVWLIIILQLVLICVIAILNYKIFKIVKEQRQRMASNIVLQRQLVQSEQVQCEQQQSKQIQSEQIQSEQVQSEQIQCQCEQEQSDQVQSDQVQSQCEKQQSEQGQSEQVQSEQVQSQCEQQQSEQGQSEQVQSEQVQSQCEQQQSEQGQSEQVQSEQVQSQCEQQQSEQLQSEQVQCQFEQQKSEQPQSEQVQSEQVQCEQAVQSEQVKSEQVKSEQQKSEQQQSEQNITWLRHLAKELKVIKTFAIIVGVLTCCFVPYIVMNMLRISRYDPCLTHIARLIANELVGINSIANAFIYALRHKKYTQAYRKLFSSTWARLCHATE